LYLVNGVIIPREESKARGIGLFVKDMFTRKDKTIPFCQDNHRLVKRDKVRKYEFDLLQ